MTEGIKDADTIKAAVLNLANIPYPQEEITEAVDESGAGEGRTTVCYPIFTRITFLILRSARP